MRTYRNAHALGANVAEAQDALAVRDDHDPDIVARPVCDKLRHRTLHRSRRSEVSQYVSQGSSGCIDLRQEARALSWVLT